MSEFFNMGGYASYIWPAYGVSALVLIGLVIQSLVAYRNVSREVESLEAGTSIYDKQSPKPEAKPETKPETIPGAAP